jgi:hypothetical protein
MSKVIDIQINGRKGKLALNTFSLDMIVEHASIVMVAKRGSGKSWVVRSLLNHFKNIPVGCIICPSDNVNPFYGNFFPQSYIHYKYDTEILESIFARQKLIKKKASEKEQLGKKIDTRCFLIMDDCLASKGSWIKDQVLKDIFFNGRHFSIMYILTMQFSLGITPELRGNFDYIFLLAEDIVSNMKRIYDHYAGMFYCFEYFKQVFTRLTENFGCMVIVNRGVRNELQDKVFYYKAPNLSNLDGDFGHKQFMDYHNNNYNPTWMDDNDINDVNDFMRKKKQNRGNMMGKK